VNVALHILKLKISSRHNNVKFGYMVLTILYDRYIFSTNACESVFLEWWERGISIFETKCPLLGRLRFPSFLETIKNIFHNHLRELIFTQFILYPQISESIILHWFISLCRALLSRFFLDTVSSESASNVKADRPRNIC